MTTTTKTTAQATSGGGVRGSHGRGIEGPHPGAQIGMTGPLTAIEDAPPPAQPPPPPPRSTAAPTPRSATRSRVCTNVLTPDYTSFKTSFY